MLNLTKEQQVYIKMRISQMETLQTSFYRDHNVVDQMKYETAIREFNKLIGED